MIVKTTILLFRYLALVQGPFGNNTLFQKVLKEVDFGYLQIVQDAVSMNVIVGV